MNQLAVIPLPAVPTVIADAGDRACYRFILFFAGQIRNPNTR